MSVTIQKQQKQQMGQHCCQRVVEVLQILAVLLLLLLILGSSRFAQRAEGAKALNVCICLQRTHTTVHSFSAKPHEILSNSVMSFSAQLTAPHPPPATLLRHRQCFHKY